MLGHWLDLYGFTGNHLTDLSKTQCSLLDSDIHVEAGVAGGSETCVLKNLSQMYLISLPYCPAPPTATLQAPILSEMLKLVTSVAPLISK